MAARIFRGLSQLGKNIQLMKPLQEQVRTFSTSPTFGPSTPIISRTGLPFITPGFDFGHPPFGPHWGQSVTVGRDGLPLSVDWTKVPGAVWPAQDQGTTGLCTKFAALGSIASLNFLKTGSLDMKAAKSVVPSAQQVFDCNTLTSYGNFGGHPWAVLDFAINNGGILLAKLYPYTGVQGQCKCIKGRGVTIDGWLFIEPHNEKALKYALCYQPVIVSIRTECPMYVDGLCIDFDEYTGGIIKGRGYTSELLDHSVLCVGYDKDEDGNPYWICLNSLSIHWGQDGLFWLNRGSRQPGGALAILREPLVPLKTSPNRIVTSKCESCGSCF